MSNITPIGWDLWKPIPGYEGLYEASASGQVRSLDRVVNGRRVRGRNLAIESCRNGYNRVTLHRDGKPRRYLVHRLVLEVFVGPAPEGTEGCHGDGDKTNNALSNLRWDTKSANQRDSIRHGTHGDARKTHCPQGHPYDVDNTYSPPHGRKHRKCKTCHSVTETARKRASRAGVPFTRAMADAARKGVLSWEN